MSEREWTDAEREAARIEWHQHGIIGVHQPRQGAAQTVPGPTVLCMTCGWMQADTYHDHLLDLVAAAKAEAAAKALREFHRKLGEGRFEPASVYVALLDEADRIERGES